ncbi:DEAD/DEAH box helicase family protein [Terrisporobacter glycolicus]|uniref:DEAD/DEAH box helicase family protein n=1 Tax=Terrisporobacter glycolicus TaxID=36841 RepID=UPI003464675B
MSFKDIEIKSSYETGIDDLVEDFYVPVLENAVRYDRIAGFFSSSSLAIAAKGIVGFLEHGKKMRIIACPKLNVKDAEVLRIAQVNPKKYLEEHLLDELYICEDTFEQQHVNAMGWMLAKGLLEIQIAFVYKNGKLCMDNEGIFHQKVGILYDVDENIVSFSGSVNESANGWLKNIEEFKVFRSWKSEQKEEYMDPDIRKFNEFWYKERPYVKMYTLPKAVEQKLISFSKDFNIEKLLVKNYKRERKYKENSDKLGLFYYQKNAIKKWKNNNEQLLIQMATGTGKTRTAIGCISEKLKDVDKLLIIIACPQGTLSLQWKKEIDTLSIGMEKYYVIDGTNAKWKNDLKELILKMEIGYYENVVVYTTHSTCSKNEFIDITSKCDKSIKILFIGDEAHGLGSGVNRRGLIDRYEYRIGLSATPSRWFDESGTIVLEKYFGNNYFEFSIADALTEINPLTKKTFLVNYYYEIKYVELTERELDRYRRISNDVIKLRRFAKNSDEYAERLENLLFKRANIIKNAEAKYDKLREILDEINNIKDTIIFVSSEQIELVLKIMGEYKIPAHRLTQNEKTTPDEKYDGKTERQDIIDKFKEGYYKVLVAIKCLDEGIDIPSASCAILMSSSTNPREYVQRIGRVIRQAPGKEKAIIYDISIKPCAKKLGILELEKFEKMVIEKERNRLMDISTNALNNSEALKLINSVMEE